MKHCRILFMVIVFLSSMVYSQQAYQDVIHLKNGDIAKGIIIENVPNNYVKLETDNGSIITFDYSDIAKFTKEKTQKKEELINSISSNEVSTNQRDSQTNLQIQKELILPSSIALGFGNSYGGIGGKFEYKFPYVALHVGIGYFPPPADYAKETLLFSGGIKVFFSKSSEMYLDLQFGTFGVEANQVSFTSYYSSYEEVTQKTLYGPSILLGNTSWFSNSVGLNGAIGATYNMVEIEWSENTKVIFALDLGLVVRF